MANEVTSQNAVQAIMKWISATALPAVVGNLVMSNLVNRDYEAVVAQSGDVVNVPIAPVLKANNILEAGTVQLQNPSLGNAQVVLNRHVECSWSISDILRVIESTDTNAIYMDSAFKAMATQLETDCLSVYPMLNALTAVGTANTALTEAVVDNIETSLTKAMVPANEPKSVVVSVDAYSTLRQIARFTEFQTVGPSGQPSPMMTGMLPGSGQGTLKGMTFFRSQYVQKVSTTTYNLAFHRNAIALVMRRLPIAGPGALTSYAEFGGYGFRITYSYNPSTFQNQMSVDALYGVGVLRNPFGIQVLS